MRYTSLALLLVLLATALLWRSSGPSTEPVAPTRSDDTRLDDGAADELQSVAGADGRVAPADAEDTADPASPADAPPPDPWAFVIHGRVLRGEEPVPGVEVVVRGREDGDERRAVTDARGAFAFEPLSGRQMVDLEVRAGAALLRDALRMRRGSGDARERVYRLGDCVLEGRVHRADGAPDAGRLVHVEVRPGAGGERYERRARAGDDGRFTVHDLPPGRVDVATAGAAPNDVSASLAVRDCRADVRLGNAPGLGRLTVDLLLPNGEPALQAFAMHAEGGEVAAPRRLRLDPDLARPGRYSVPAADGRYLLELRPPLPGPAPEVDVAPGAPPLRLVLPGAVVRGRLAGRTPRWPNPVTGAPGLDAADSNVDAVLRDPSTGARLRSTRIKDSNRFELTGVAPGHYLLVTEGANPAAEPVEVRIQATTEVLDVTLRLPGE